MVRGAKIGGRKNSIPCQLFLELYSSLTVSTCLVQSGRWIEIELRIPTVNVITNSWPWHLKRYHTTFVHLKHLSLLKENAQRTDVCICSDPQIWVQSALNQAMQLLVYVWTQVKGQTLHWVKANFLAGGKTTSLWWISDACRLCDLHFISCNLLFCLTGSIPFVSSFEH